MADELRLLSTIGFSGKVSGGLIAHPNGKHIVYPLGSLLVVMEKGKPATQRFLTGHKTEITAVAVSHSGRYIASGQYSNIDRESEIIVWDFNSLTLLYRWTMHKDSVMCLSFSSSDKFLASLGGDDRIVIWDIEEGQGFHGDRATIGSTGRCNAVCFSKNDDTLFVSGGLQNLRFWRIDIENRTFKAENAKLDQTKRTITTIDIDDRDTFVYCGTTTGDVLKVAVNQQKLMTYGPRKALGQGITSLSVAPWGDPVVGSGCGQVAVLDPNFKILAQATLNGMVTSVSMVPSSNNEIICGTSESDIISINTDNFKPSVISNGHSSAINDLTFPPESSELFLTSALGGFHVWNSRKYSELLRVHIPRTECYCLAVPADGKVIVTGWSDGRIKGFSPQFGKELWVINDAHLNGVTAMAVHDNITVTGGMTGDICVWNIDSRVHSLVATLKEHHQRISQIKFNADGSEFVTASQDGSVILWETSKLVSKQRFLAQTFFNGVNIHHDTAIIVTVSSDKRLIFWDAFNASIIRELEASLHSPPNSLCISPDGRYIATGGDDKIVKVWDFQTGEVIAEGKGHCGNIKKVLYSPDQSILVSIGAEGGIYIWKMQ